MNTKNYFKKKDIIVMLVNLLVLTIVIYIYYIVENVKTILSIRSSLCVLKTTSDIQLTKDNLEEIYFDSSEMKSHKVQIRQKRSADSIKFQKSSLFFLAQPSKDFEQNGILGPWILSNKSVTVDTNLPIKLTSRRTLLEIVDEGIYLVYIQVYYLSTSKRNSFVMTKMTADVNETLTVCSAMSVSGAEISCFTSIVEYFKAGESILIRLREMSSHISLNRKVSHTYLGFTKLM